MRIRTVALTSFTVLSIAYHGGAYAADIAPPPDTSDWTFTGAAYLWASGIEGQSGISGFPPQDIDMSFSDVLEHLDGAFMGVGEARNGPFSIGIDLSYARLQANVETPLGIAATDIDVESTSFMGTGIIGYAVVDTGTTHLDIVGGARVWSASTSFDFNGGVLNGQNAGDDATWVDPLVGAKFKADLGSDFYVSGWGLVGGFGVSSDLMWDVMGGVGYDVSDSFSLFAGYRAVSVDYDRNGFVYDVVQQGPIFAGVFRF